jgi:hypothetical protein
MENPNNSARAILALGQHGFALLPSLLTMLATLVIVLVRGSVGLSDWQPCASRRRFAEAAKPPNLSVVVHHLFAEWQRCGDGLPLIVCTGVVVDQGPDLSAHSPFADQKCAHHHPDIPILTRANVAGTFREWRMSPHVAHLPIWRNKDHLNVTYVNPRSDIPAFSVFEKKGNFEGLDSRNPWRWNLGWRLGLDERQKCSMALPVFMSALAVTPTGDEEESNSSKRCDRPGTRPRTQLRSQCFGLGLCCLSFLFSWAGIGLIPQSTSYRRWLLALTVGLALVIASGWLVCVGITFLDSGHL